MLSNLALRRLTKDALKFYDPQFARPSCLPLTRSLLQSCKTAYAAYQAHLEQLREEKRKACAEKAEEEIKKDDKRTASARESKREADKEREKNLNKDEALAKEDLAAGQAIVEEGNAKLTKVIKRRT